jgi:hypothetical protein
MNKLNLIILIALALIVSIPASATITHRYDFVADANDVIGGLETVLETGAVVQDGQLVLAGGSPGARAVLDGPGIGINTYTGGVSVEFWFTPAELSGWTRVFDFGGTSGNDGGHYWFYTPSGPGNSRVALSTGGFPGWSAGEQIVNGPALTVGTTYHVICTFDPAGGTGGNAAMKIYQDGVQVGANTAVTYPWSGVHNTFAYLGSAVYPGDPELNGSIDEFRIYNKALTPAEARFTNHFGPDEAYPIALRTLSPADGTTKLPVTPAFSWTPEPEIEVDSYTLYYGTDPNIADPNQSDLSAIADVIVAGLLSPAHTVTAGSKLDYFTEYYWRVDTVATDETVYQGVGMRFQTIAEIPAVTDDPDITYVQEGADATFTAVCESISSFTSIKWFKSGTPAVEITTADADVTISNVIEAAGAGYTATSTLMIDNTEAADLGSYYAEFRNEAGPSITASAELRFKKLLAYWPFENNLIDATGNGYNGTAMSHSTGMQITPAFAAGVAGQAVDLSNTAYIDLVDGLADDFSGGFTFNLWAYPRTAAVWARFLSFNNGQNSDNIFFTRVGVEPTLRLQIVKGSSGTGGALDASVINQNIWQMFTVTMAPDGQAVIYENGVPAASGIVQTPNVIARTNNWIGQSAWPDAQFNGLLDDIRIYNYPLTPTEVAKLYTDIRTTEYVCVEDPENPLTFDINNDCRVDLEDIKELALWWMECDRVPASACSL